MMSVLWEGRGIMVKIVLIGAGSGFGAETVADVLSHEELRESEIVLVDVNPDHLDPIGEYACKVARHHDAPTTITLEPGWRDGVLDGADYVITSFAQGGPAYNGVPFHYELAIPREYGIHQNVGDTAGVGGVFRLMRTAPELVAIGEDMQRRCPGAWLLNYVNPMAMLTRTLNIACPDIRTLGLCHNVQYGIRHLAERMGCSHKDLVYTAAGVNHMVWFTRIEYADGRDAYPDVLPAVSDAENDKWHLPVQLEVLKHFGYWTTESSNHCAEYLPYFMPREADRKGMGVKPFNTAADFDGTAARWAPDSDLMQQLAGTKPLDVERGFEYGAHIVHAHHTGRPRRVHVNAINRGSIENLPDDCCVEVAATVDGEGVKPEQVGALPPHLAALCRGLADMQSLASDAFLEKDLQKAFHACLIDPCTAASATPAKIRECFNKLLEAEREWLEPYWGRDLDV